MRAAWLRDGWLGGGWLFGGFFGVGGLLTSRGGGRSCSEVLLFVERGVFLLGAFLASVACGKGLLDLLRPTFAGGDSRVEDRFGVEALFLREASLVFLRFLCCLISLRQGDTSLLSNIRLVSDIAPS